MQAARSWAAPADDSPRDDWAQADSALDGSVQADSSPAGWVAGGWALDDSVRGDSAERCWAPADSAEADCWAARMVNDHCAPVVAQERSVQVDSVRGDSAQVELVSGRLFAGGLLGAG